MSLNWPNQPEQRSEIDPDLDKEGYDLDDDGFAIDKLDKPLKRKRGRPRKEKRKEHIPPKIKAPKPGQLPLTEKLEEQKRRKRNFEYQAEEYAIIVGCLKRLGIRKIGQFSFRALTAAQEAYRCQLKINELEPAVADCEGNGVKEQEVLMLMNKKVYQNSPPYPRPTHYHTAPETPEALKKHKEGKLRDRRAINLKAQKEFQARRAEEVKDVKTPIVEIFTYEDATARLTEILKIKMLAIKRAHEELQQYADNEKLLEKVETGIWREIRKHQTDLNEIRSYIA